jgi:hypothetical protein
MSQCKLALANDDRDGHIIKSTLLYATEKRAVLHTQSKHAVFSSIYAASPTICAAFSLAMSARPSPSFAKPITSHMFIYDSLLQRGGKEAFENAARLSALVDALLRLVGEERFHAAEHSPGSCRRWKVASPDA